MIESFPEWRGTRSGIFLFSCCASRSCFRSEVVLMRKNRPPTRKIAHLRKKSAPVPRKSLMLVLNSLLLLVNRSCSSRTLLFLATRSCSPRIRFRSSQTRSPSQGVAPVHRKFAHPRRKFSK